MIFPNKKQGVFILSLLLVSHAMSGDYIYLKIQVRENRRQLDSKKLYQHFTQALDPNVIVIPNGHWARSGTGPSPLIEEFQKTIKGGFEVKPLSDELNAMIDLKANELFSPNTPLQGTKQGTHLSTIRWTDTYFLVGTREFVTFGLVEGGYVVCTNDEAGFIERRKQ